MTTELHVKLINGKKIIKKLNRGCIYNEYAIEGFQSLYKPKDKNL
jgi:hypothetical protein